MPQPLERALSFTPASFVEFSSVPSSTGPISLTICSTSDAVTTVLCGPRNLLHLSAMACSRSAMISRRSGLSLS